MKCQTLAQRGLRGLQQSPSLSQRTSCTHYSELITQRSQQPLRSPTSCVCGAEVPPESVPSLGLQLATSHSHQTHRKRERNRERGRERDTRTEGEREREIPAQAGVNFFFRPLLGCSLPSGLPAPFLRIPHVPECFSCPRIALKDRVWIAGSTLLDRRNAPIPMARVSQSVLSPLKASSGKRDPLYSIEGICSHTHGSGLYSVFSRFTHADVPIERKV